MNILGEESVVFIPFMNAGYIRNYWDKNIISDDLYLTENSSLDVCHLIICKHIFTSPPPKLVISSTG